MHRACMCHDYSDSSKLGLYVLLIIERTDILFGYPFFLLFSKLYLWDNDRNFCSLPRFGIHLYAVFFPEDYF